MKKLLFGLIATVMFGFVGNAQTEDEVYNAFFKSSNFSKISETFGVKLSDVNMTSFYKVQHQSKLYYIYRT